MIRGTLIGGIAIAVGVASEVSDAIGSVSVNVEPIPSVLCSVRSPRIARASSLLIESPSPTPCCFAEVEGLCALQAKANGLTLTVTPCDRHTVVAADAERFQQILLNLITNAIKFTSTGGSIGVTCDTDAGVVQIRVKDSGVGVRPVDIDRVFEPFVQIDRHLTSAKQQGVGLGLSISRELARAMRGDLTLQSTEGVGSTFTLTLPIASETSLPTPIAMAIPPINVPRIKSAVAS